MGAQVSNGVAGTRHFAYLDGVRGLAALEVFLGHAALQIHWESGPSTSIISALIWPMTFGREAVALFIVLSGFCLTLPVVRRDGVLEGGAWLFFKRRARRILPPYYFALGLSLLLIWTLIGEKTSTHWDVALPADGKAIWSHLLLMQDLFHDTSSRINNVMWSISVEWRIYFLFPLFVLLWRKAGAAVTTFVVVASSYVLVRWLNFDWLNTGTYGLCPQFIGLFALGMFGASIGYSNAPQMVRLRQLVPWGTLALATLVAVLIAREVKLWRGSVPWYLRDYILGIFCMSLLIFVAAKPNSTLHRLLAWKPVALLGTFGYSLYLIHSPFLQIITQYVITPLRLAPVPAFALLLSLGSPVILLLSYGFHLICERPFLNAPVVVSGQVKFSQARSTGVADLGASGH